MYNFIRYLPLPALVLKANSNLLIILEANLQIADIYKFNAEVELNFSMITHLEGIGFEKKFIAQVIHSIQLVNKLLIPQTFDFIFTQHQNNKQLVWKITNSPVFTANGIIDYILQTIEDKSNLAQLNAAILTNKNLIKIAENTAKIGTWELNLATNKLTCSDGLFTMCGFKPQSFQVTFDIGLTVIHPDDREFAIKVMQNAINNGIDFDIIKRLLLNNEEIKYIRSSAKILYDEDSNPIQLIGVFQDITAEENLKLSLEKSLKKYQKRNEFIETIIQNIPIGISVNNIETGEATFTNNQFYKTYGWNENDFNNIQTFAEKVYPDEIYRNKMMGIIMEDLASKDPNRMIWNKIAVTTSGGDERYVNAKNIPLYSQNLMISTVLDVTKLTLQAQEIIENNNRYKYVTKATFDAIWDWDLITDNMYWDAGFNAIFGYEIKQLKNNSSDWKNKVHEDDYQEVNKSKNNAIEGTNLYWSANYRYKKSDNTYAFVTDKSYLVRNEHGKVIRMVGAIQDISKQKLEEERLKLLESVITNTSDAIVITEAEPLINPGPKIIYVNEAFTKMTGYSADDVIGKSPRILQGPKSDKLELKKLSESLKKWEPCELTIINYKKNGEEFWNNFKINPVENKLGCFTHWVAIERDITKAKKDEESMKTLYFERNKILESIFDAFFSINNDGDVNYWNKNAEILLDVDAKEIIGKNLWDYFESRRENEVFLNYKKAINENRTIHFTTFSEQKNNWLEISAFPSVNGLSVYIKNITDKKLAELAVAKELEYRNNILENLGDGFYTLDNNLIVTYWNKRSEELTGRSRQEMLGESIWKFYKDKDTLLPHFMEALSSNKSKIIEVFYQKFDQWFELNIHSYNGILSIYFQNITNKKKINLELEESEKRYSDIFRLNPQPMYVYDPESFKIIQVNNEAVKVYGYTENEFLSKTVFDIIVGENKNVTISQLNKPDINNESYQDIQRHLIKSNEIIEVEVFRNNIIINNKIYRLIVVNNITERLKHLQAIEKQNKILQDIAWTQSHKVRAPLSRIMSLINHINDSKLADEEFNNLLEFLSISSKELDEIIKEIVLKSEQIVIE